MREWQRAIEVNELMNELSEKVDSMTAMKEIRKLIPGEVLVKIMAHKNLYGEVKNSVIEIVQKVLNIERTNVRLL